jgi:hypothetical protein
MNVLLGYEIGTGRKVEIPVLHMVVTGQTQQSGKTTTLEALIRRSGLRAVTFVTKRAEGAFTRAPRIPAYFRERADWEFVVSLLEATMRAKMKFEHPWIMRACRGAKTLKQVQANLEEGQRKATRGLDESIYLALSMYLAKVVPAIEQMPYSSELKLEPGVNVMDLSSYASEVQALVISSVLERIYERERKTISLIPEAWEFIPEGRNSPVKRAAEALIRKGGSSENHMWIDSQDLAGVDKKITRSCSVWIMGVQRQALEVKRSLEAIPAGLQTPKPADIMQLGRGEFFASFGRELHQVYVQPAWLDDHPERAIRYAKEELPACFVAPPDGWERAEPAGKPRKKPAAKPDVNTIVDVNGEVEMKDAIEELAYLKLHDYVTHAWAIELLQVKSPETFVDLIIRLLKELKQRRSGLLEGTDPGDVARAQAAPDVDAIVAKVIARLQDSGEIPALNVSAEKPEITVTVQRKLIDLDGSTLKGRLAQMVAGGWFDEAKTGHSAYNELQRRGFATAKPNVYRELDALANWGFVTKEPSGGFLAVAGMKINLREMEAE